MTKLATFRKLSLAAAAICASGCHALPQTSGQRPQKVEYIHTTEVMNRFDPAWLPLINYAIAHVDKRQTDGNCYEVWLRTGDNERYVSFVRHYVSVETGRGGEVEIKPKDGCPEGATFAFGPDDKFVRMVEWRD